MIEIINQLKELSFNLYWSFNNEFISIFEEINRDYWKWSQKNPVKFLTTINDDYLLDVIEKRNLRERIHKIYREFRNYMNDKETYFRNNYYTFDSPKICYLSAEYGIAKCLKFYSGGLGTLSGDHLKSASDLGLPLVAVGLAYNYGYLRQYINKEKRQSELYEKNEFNLMPMTLMLDEDYRALKICFDLPGREVYAQIWELKIGRVKLYLLDTFVDENNVEDKSITDILYGGGTEKRILQEILLGIGGMKVLELLRIEPKAFHINEGHSAFLVFERIKNTVKKFNIEFDEAKDICYYSNIFTTHTPVSAGIDIFPRYLMEKYFKEYAEKELEIPFDRLFLEGDLANNGHDKFNMAMLAINNSNFVNAVSKVHGVIARKMWSLPADRSQIVSITNGVHIKTYMSKHTERLYIKHFGKEWYKNQNIWGKVSEIPDEEIWRARNRSRRSLVYYVRERIADKLKLAKEPEEEIADVENLLDENALTIGFARRFATYKRGNLIFRNPERLKKIISNTDRKIQFIFSGKAHPQDEGGKNLISEIVTYSGNEKFKNKLVFVENYDVDVAKYLVSGCDIWLNNPRRPLEASGTSGMKTVANFGLNFSILDGWWLEGYSENSGWKIDSPDNFESTPPEEVDNFESESLYSILEKDIIPLFYKRNDKQIPVEWIKKIKSSVASLAPFFNTERMVKEYNEMFYMKVR
jgi:starch phosphorylase